jgi:hypothetical protein
LPDRRGDKQGRQQKRDCRNRGRKSEQSVIVVKIREAIEPQISQHHRVQIKPDKVAEAKIGKCKQPRDSSEGDDRGHGAIESRGVIEYVKSGADFCNVDEGYAAEGDVRTNQECQSETLGSFAGHQPSSVCIPQHGILPRNQITPELGRTTT